MTVNEMLDNVIRKYGFEVKETLLCKTVREIPKRGLACKLQLQKANEIRKRGATLFFGGAVADLARRFVQNIQITAFFRRSFVQYAENKKS